MAKMLKWLVKQANCNECKGWCESWQQKKCAGNHRVKRGTTNNVLGITA